MTSISFCLTSSSTNFVVNGSLIISAVVLSTISPLSFSVIILTASTMDGGCFVKLSKVISIGFSCNDFSSISILSMFINVADVFVDVLINICSESLALLLLLDMLGKSMGISIDGDGADADGDDDKLDDEFVFVYNLDKLDK